MKKEELLKLYENYNNEDLISYAINSIQEYNVIQKSEEVAKRILEANNINFYYLHEDFKRNLKKMLFCVRMRGIRLPENCGMTNITVEDIIERIKENEVCQINMYQKDKKFSFEDINTLYDNIIHQYESFMNEGKSLK